MGEYRHRTSGEIKTQGEWRRAYPQTSFPRVWNQSTLDFLEVDPVLSSPKPIAGQYETVRRNGAVQDSKGNWVEAWEVVPMFSDYVDENGVTHTAAEQESDYRSVLNAAKASEVRDKRNAFLRETDWLVIYHTEKGTNIPMAWEAYRQALRDVPDQDGFPFDVVWPEKPVS